MTAKNVEFRVGIVVLLGVFILAASLYWLQGYKLKVNSIFTQVVFDDVGTLSIGDRVTVSGVRKGKVSDLKLTDRGVLVELQLNQDVVLKRDATFTIKNMGLMGERFIAVNPGRDSIPFDLSQPVRGQYDTGLPEVMGLMGEMIVDLRSLVASFRRTIGSDSTLGKFDRTVDNLERVSTSLATYLERHESSIDQTVNNFLQASARLNSLVKSNAPKVDSSLTRFDRVSARLDTLVIQMDTLSMAAREFADKLNNPDGTVNLLLEDRRLYDDLRRTADNIDDLITDIRANPRKYINLTVEIF